MSVANQINRHAKAPTTTIANGATKSAAILFDAYAFGLYFIPSAFTGASVSFEVSYDGTNFAPLYDASGSLLSTTVSSSRAFPFPDEVAGAYAIKIVSGSSEGAARTIQLSLKG